ncbi:MAG: SprT family zinc-dependent metalloprotease [Mariprofundaceae bacterium]|nr:SprT family zinc-dependent metalloprotease [Mariprofundaceae bacterium]
MQETMITVSGIEIKILRKKIKNMHLGVYPPNGHVRVSVPKHVSDDHVRLAIVSKLSWIKKKQQVFKDQPRQSERTYVSGECHYFLGQRYRLELIERAGKAEVTRLKSGKLKMFVKASASIASKEKLLNAWYRAELKYLIPILLDKWQPIIGKYADEWGIKKMKTKWGSCNIDQRRIWLNLELVKKPPECLEYVVVHELVHLHERYHNAHFKALMTQFVPNWKSRQKTLNQSTLAHED